MTEFLKYSETLENDGYIGIPLDIRTYYIGTPTEKTPVLLYVVNTNTKRIGTDSDEEIISRLINEKGFTVVVLDYKNNEKAVCPGLDWSIQQIRCAIDKDGKYLNGAAYKKRYSYVLPAGYDITLDEYYWSFDKHGSDGSIDKIVEIWNNDFRGVKGERTVKYPDGTETKVKDIVASSIFDCVRDDGRQLDLDLRMDIFYPTNPEHKVPVMALYSSSEIRIDAWMIPARPHLTGFLFAGYAGVVFDYGYTPMARTDHYGYFDGNGAGCRGYITGDNYTYSLDVFSGIKSTTAAIRKLRWLADMENTKYKFDVDRFGVYGNSKGGLCTRLGIPDATNVQEQRWFPGHHGETRYENGDTETVEVVTEHGVKYTVHGGEPQPWLTYRNGKSIPSNVQFVYSNCGGGYEDIIEGHAPTYASGSMKDNSYRAFFTGVVNHCRIHDVPMLNFSLSELAHGLAYGNDKDYGVDSYQALFDMAHYYLNGEGAVCEYIAFSNERVPSFTFRFSGAISESEIKKATVTEKSSGKVLDGRWSSGCGKLLWVFEPCGLEAGKEYICRLPDSVICENGTKIKAEKLAEFKMADADERLVSASVNGSTASAVVDINAADGKKAILSFNVKNDASNRAEVYADGKKIDEIALVGKGRYEIDVTALAGTKTEFTIAPKFVSDTKSVLNIDFSEKIPDVLNISELASAEVTNELGEPALKINYFSEFEKFMPYHRYHYNYNQIGSFYIKPDAMTEADFGRRFKLEYKLYDTDTRTHRADVTPWSSENYDLLDWNAKMLTVKTQKDKWKPCSIDWKVDKKAYIEGDQRLVKLICETRTAEQKLPIYISNISVKEILTEVEFGNEFRIEYR